MGLDVAGERLGAEVGVAVCGRPTVGDAVGTCVGALGGVGQIFGPVIN